MCKKEIKFQLFPQKSIKTSKFIHYYIIKCVPLQSFSQKGKGEKQSETIIITQFILHEEISFKPVTIINDDKCYGRSCKVWNLEDYQA